MHLNNLTHRILASVQFCQGQLHPALMCQVNCSEQIGPLHHPLEFSRINSTISIDASQSTCICTILSRPICTQHSCAKSTFQNRLVFFIILLNLFYRIAYSRINSTVSIDASQSTCICTILSRPICTQHSCVKSTF